MNTALHSGTKREMFEFCLPAQKEKLLNFVFQLWWKSGRTSRRQRDGCGSFSPTTTMTSLLLLNFFFTCSVCKEMSDVRKSYTWLCTNLPCFTWKYTRYFCQELLSIEHIFPPPNALFPILDGKIPGAPK